MKVGKFRLSRWFYQIGVVAGGVVAVFLVIGAAYSAAYWGKIVPGVEIAGLQVGNMTGEEASKLIGAKIKEGEMELAVVSGEEKWTITGEEVGLVIDLPSTINEAWMVGRKGSLLERLGQAQTSFFNGKRLPIVVRVDEEKMEIFTSDVAAALDQEAVNPAVSLDKKGKEKKVEVNRGQDGWEVNQGLLRGEILKRWSFLTTQPVEVPIVLVKTEISEEEAGKVRVEAERLIGKESVIKYDGEEWRLGDAELIGLLKAKGEGGFDEERVKVVVGELAEGLNREPQNAAFKFEEGKVQEFRPGRDGWTVVEEDLVRKIMESYTTLFTKDSIEISVVVVKVPPKIRTSQVNDLGIRELIGKGESSYTHSIPNRVHNVSLAANRVAGTLVAPGEVFSFNEAVGEVSAATGYKSAYVISGGRTILGDGGGVCQVSTTLFRAALNAGLPITERKAHAYRVSYYEEDSLPGIDATVYAPTVDLKFKNDTPAHILIQPIIDEAKRHLTFEIYGTSDGREVQMTQPKIWGQSPPPPAIYQDDPTLPLGTVRQIDWAASGARTSFDYKVVRNGEVIFEKTFTSVFRPWQAVYLRGTKTE